MDQRYYWGIDLGGTKIEAVVLDSDNDYEIIARHRQKTEGHLGYEKVLDNIKNLISFISDKYKIEAQRIGVGTPGSISPYNGNLRNCNSLYLNGHPIKKDLESLLGLDIRITNDANCFAVSEYKIGVIKEKYPEAKVVFGVIMGTGVGSGIVVDGQIIEGKNGIGGEWGHNYLDESGTDCYCGKSGCVESILSGPSLENYYFNIAKQKKSLKDIVSDYRNNTDIYARTTMERLFHFFPIAVSNVINIIDPDVIVIGGGLGNIDELYTKGVKNLTKYVFSDYVNTEFTKPKFGDSSGVLGAALLWT